MTTEEALALVLQEGLGSGGLVSVVWAGSDPGSARAWRCRDALKVVFDSLEGKTELGRELAVALYRLAGLHSHVHIAALGGVRFRREYLENELPALSLAAESVFNDAWEQ